ncbi:MAG TPA: hypothetical protein VKD90_24995 [Gemmataceae bacterium]|nr:hypothetical protein [Gemmataceae bacterium]
MRPTRAYRHPVQTIVYVRGFVNPAPGSELPGLRCEYVFGSVEQRGVRQSFEPPRPDVETGARRAGPLDEMTRVTLTPDPQQWDRDLELVPGTTAAGTMALAVTGWAGKYALVWSILLGATLGLLLPVVTVRGADRQSADWLFGVLSGAAVAFSLWACLAVFGIWRSLRSEWRPRRPVAYAAVPALAVAHFGIVYGVCRGLAAWIVSEG